MTKKEAVKAVARKLRVRSRDWKGWEIRSHADAVRLADEVLSSGATDPEIMEVADRAEDRGTYDKLLAEIARETLAVLW